MFDNSTVAAIFIGIILYLLPYGVKAMPWYITWPGIAVCSAVVLWKIGLIVPSSTSPLPQIIGFIGAFLFAFGVLLYWTQTTPKALQSANIVHIECQLGLMPSSRGKRIYALSLFPTPIENGGGGLVEYFSLSEKESQFSWPKSALGVPLTAYRCALTNYSADPLFNLRMKFHLRFIEQIVDAENPNTSRSGATLLERDWPIAVNKIDPGKAEPFEMYIFSMLPDKFVEVKVVPEATAMIDGEDKALSLVGVSDLMMHFDPFVEAK